MESEQPGQRFPSLNRGTRETVTQSGWRAAGDGLVESVTSLPMMMGPLKSEVDENGSQPWLYPVQLYQTKTEITEVEIEAPTNNPAEQIKSETDGEDYVRPELTTDPNSNLQPTHDRKTSGSPEIEHLSHFGPRMENDDQGWNSIRAHGSGVNSNVENNTASVPSHKRGNGGTLGQSGWGAAGDGLVNSVTSLPMMMAPLKSEDDENGSQPWLYPVQLYHFQTGSNTEMEASTNNPAEQIKSETDGEDYVGPELSTNPNSNLEPTSDRKTSGSSEIEHLSHFGPEMENNDEGWNNIRAHGSCVNTDGECNTCKKSLGYSEWGEEFQYQPSLQRHLTKRSLSCVNGNECFGIIQHVNLQKQVCTEKETISCDVCGKIFRRKDDLKVHMRIHAGEKPFSCDDCGRRFSRRTHLNRHMRIHTGEKPFECDECGRRFSLKESLNLHMRIHTGDKPFSCDECGHRFSRKESLNQHMRIHTGDKPFSCDECGHKFSLKTNLNRHMRIHTRDRPFSCDECGHVFSPQSSLTQQMRIHTRDRPFSCDECGHRFSSQSSLTQQMRIHIRDRPFSCDECGQSFRQKTHLNDHMRIHTGERPFSCEACGQRFSRKTDLNQHLKIHTGERPFSCDECGQRFSRKTNLNQHLRIHTGERPFSCDECGQRFSHSTSLNKHMRIHTGERPFPCEVCGELFRWRKTLNGHMRVHLK